MKVFTRDYRITGDYPSAFTRYFGNMKPCVFDIETTGLDAYRCKVCLTAMLTRTESGVRITQFLAENHYEENRVIQATMDFFESEGIDYLITFNGQAFDVPFMNRRMEYTFMDGRISMFNFDLYKLLSKGTDLRKHLSSLSQKSLENYYGILDDRNDVITGRESVTMFNEYAVTGNSTLEKVILTHNREDVLHLHRLMFLSIADIEDFDSAIASVGFPLLGGKYSVRPHLSSAKKLLRIRGDQLQDAVSAAFFPDLDSNITALFNSTSSAYEIDIPVGCLNTSNAIEFYFDAEAEGIDLSDDPDCINGFLILNPRTVNVAAARLTEKVISRITPCF